MKVLSDAELVHFDEEFFHMILPERKITSIVGPQHIAEQGFCLRLFLLCDFDHTTGRTDKLPQKCRKTPDFG